MNNEEVTRIDLTEYFVLLDLLLKLAEANRGNPADELGKAAESVLYKFYSHAISVSYLSRGTKIDDLSNSHVNFIDAPSINVLGRAAIESFLVFHSIFIAPETADKKEFKLLCWILSGLLERRKFSPISNFGRERLTQDAEQIEILKTRLNSNSFFQSLHDRDRKEYITKGKWRGSKSWAEMGKDAGLSPAHASSFYRFLCEYAHTGYLCILQIEQASTRESQNTLCEATIDYMMIAMANMIKLYASLFPRSAQVFHQDVARKHIVERWVLIGSNEAVTQALAQ